MNLTVRIPGHVPLKLLLIAARQALELSGDNMLLVTSRLVDVSLVCSFLMGQGSADFLTVMAQHGMTLQPHWYQYSPLYQAVNCDIFCLETQPIDPIHLSLNGKGFNLDHLRWVCSAPASRCGTCLRCLQLEWLARR